MVEVLEETKQFYYVGVHKSMSKRFYEIYSCVL